VELSVF